MDCPPTLVFETVYGSRAFGLATASSDEDLRGVIVGPPAWYHGFVGGPEQIDLGKDHVRFGYDTKHASTSCACCEWGARSSRARE